MCTKKSAKKRTETSNRMLTKFVSIGSYSPTFGTLITSTKVFTLRLLLLADTNFSLLYLAGIHFSVFDEFLIDYK